MGNACLGRPRPNSKLMEKKTPESRYRSSREEKYAEKAVQGECETNNRLKVKMSLLTCSVCMQTYNVSSREPQLVCPNNHTYCRECVEQCMRTNRRCPECRSEMRAPVRNRDIYELVKSNVKLIEERQLVEVEAEEEEAGGEVQLSVAEDNPLLGSFWIKGDRIMKVENNRVWEGLVAAETFPKDKDSSFTVRVLISEFNNIKVGIAGVGYQSKPGVTCPEAVLYHLADGKILEGGRGVGSEWRGQGQIARRSKEREVVVECRVSPQRRRVGWYQDDIMLGEGRFSQYLLSNSFTAYLMLCQKGDTVAVNS